MSLLLFLTVARSAGGVQQLFEATEGAAQELVLEDGAGEEIGRWKGDCQMEGCQD